MLNKGKDGKLTKKEFVEGMENEMGKFGARAPDFGDGKPDWGAYFDYIDRDGSGFIYFQEFKCASMERSTALDNENLDKVYDILKNKKTGTLDKTQKSV